MKRILDVRKVAFYGSTGDLRSPESYPLPSCMTSMLETMGDDTGAEIIDSGGKQYLYRLMNTNLLAASGMAFGLLWSDDYCPSSLDVTQVNSIEETLRRAFGWAGRDYVIIYNDGPESRARALAMISESIDNGAPALAFGLMGMQECAIIAGYDGETLVGWCHFQDDMCKEREENGMFRAENWGDSWRLFVVPGGRMVRTITDSDVFFHGAEVMKQTGMEGYRCGQAAYDAWEDALRRAPDTSDEARQALYAYHHMMVFHLAELRCWGGEFLLRHDMKKAGTEFKQIHSLCWALDAAAGEVEKWRALNKPDKLIDALNEIRACDIRALRALEGKL